jgi:hypothetical protein
MLGTGSWGEWLERNALGKAVLPVDVFPEIN